MAPTGLFRVMNRELAHLSARRDNRLLLIWLPLMLVLSMAWIFSGGIPRALPLTLVDADQSSTSRQVARLVDAAPGVAITRAAPDLETADADLRRHDSYGVLYIPSGFGGDLSRGADTELALQYNAQWVNHAGQVSREVQQAVGAFNAGVEIAAYERRDGQSLGAASRTMPVTVEALPLHNPALDYSRFLQVPLTFAILQILATLAIVSLVGRELRDHTVPEWLDAASGRLTAVAGKAVFCWLIMSLWTLALTLWLMADGTLPRHGVGATITLLAGHLLLMSAAVATGLLIIALTRNLRMGLSVAGFYAAPAFAFAGQAYPLAAMPDGAQFWANLLPLTHWLSFYNQAGLGGYNLVPLYPDARALLMFTLLAGLPALLLLRREGFNASAWGGR